MKKFKDFLDENEELSNYMFFSNLKEIKLQIEELLLLDESLIDGMLNNGHDWANDHISSATELISQVSNFFKNNIKK